jgi:hypothetical protein
LIAGINAAESETSRVKAYAMIMAFMVTAFGKRSANWFGGLHLLDSTKKVDVIVAISMHPCFRTSESIFEFRVVGVLNSL